MRIHLIIALVAMCCLSAGSVADQDSAEDSAKTKEKPTTRPPETETHTERNIEGYTVVIDNALLEGEHKETGDVALRLLANKLYELALVLPSDRIEKLKKVRIRIDHKHPLRNMQYHPGRDWLVKHGYDPVLHKVVHIPSVRHFLAVHKSNSQPWVVLHELAHAYHDQYLSFDNEEIIAAFEAAKESKKYESVLLYSGRKVRHYALTNHKEFFAEMTEAYVGTNDFYPFVRAELKEYDEATHELMKKIWRDKE